MARQRKKKPTESQAVEMIAAALLIGGSAEATAATLSPMVGIPGPALLAALIIARTRPLPLAGTATIPSTSAVSEYARTEAAYRAHYVYAASRRLGTLTGEKRREAIAREQQYFNQHMAASQNRHTTAINVDRAKNKYGDELGWYAKMDSRTSAECKEANGKNFSASRAPAIGYPGAVHPNCRCRPGKKHATSATVYSVQPRDIHAA